MVCTSDLMVNVSLYSVFDEFLLPCGTTEFDCSNFVDKSPRRVSEQSRQTKLILRTAN